METDEKGVLREIADARVPWVPRARSVAWARAILFAGATWTWTTTQTSISTSTCAWSALLCLLMGRVAFAVEMRGLGRDVSVNTWNTTNVGKEEGE